MILQMEKFTLFAFAQDKDRLLRELMRKKCVQLDAPDTLPDYEQICKLAERENVQLFEQEQTIGRLSAALAALSSYEEKPALFAKKRVVAYEELGEDAVQYALGLAQAIETNRAHAADIAAAKSQDQFLLQSLQPWEKLDLPLDYAGSAACLVRFYLLPATADLPALKEGLERELPAHLELVSEDKDQKYLCIVLHNSCEGQVAERLKQHNAVRATFPPFVQGAARQVIRSIEERFAIYERYLQRLEKELAETAANAPALKLGYDAASLQLEQQRAKANLLLTDSLFVVTGWVPAEDKPKLDALLKNYECCCEYQPAQGDEAPIKLKNNQFAKPFEFITEMYSLPAYTGVDPSFVMAPFFILFFGMMLSDAGYGLLLLIIGLVVLFKYKPEGAMNGIMKLVVMCGASTVVWGAIYGGWFGNLIPQVAETFFGKTVTVPLLLDPLNDPISIIIISFLFGAVHLFTGMWVKASLLVRRGHLWDAVFDIGLWYLVLVGIGMLLLPGILQTIGMYMAIAGAVGLILTQGRHEKNIIMKLLKGIMSLYDITSYFSDILSYSRILALGLATGVIANVVNIMGTLPGANVIGVIAFVLIFALGHSLNLAINALGSYVHTSRLQYVEFFGKFYESGGVAFRPFAPQTKYTMFESKE